MSTTSLKEELGDQMSSLNFNQFSQFSSVQGMEPTMVGGVFPQASAFRRDNKDPLTGKLLGRGQQPIPPQAFGGQNYLMDMGQQEVHDEFSDLSHMKSNHIGAGLPLVGTGRPVGAPGSISSGITGSIGPENFGGDQFGEYDYEDHEIGDAHQVSMEEERRRGDPRFDISLDFMPKNFKKAEEALDTYNEIGFRIKVQFRLYEQKRKEGKVVMFSLVCAMKNNPKLLPKYTGGTFSKLSQCCVNVRFVYNSASDSYDRVEGSFKSIHDHKLELEDRVCLPSETMRDIKHWWMDDSNIKVSQIIKRVRDASHQVNEKGQSIYMHLKHLDVLNALKIIRGAGLLNMEELMQDIQNVSMKYPDSKVEINTGTPLVVFVQTNEMLSLHRLYRGVIMVNVSRRRKNKYDFYVIKLTGINNFGNALVFAIAFTNIKCKATYDFVFKQFLERAQTEFIGAPKLMILPIDEDLLDSQTHTYKQAFPEQTIDVITNQHMFLAHAKDMIVQYRKRMDFDFILCCEKLDSLIQETNQKQFESTLEDIKLLVSVLDKATVAEFDKLWRHEDKWSLLKYRHLYTAGLHSNERAAYIDTFMQIQHKFDSNLVDMIENCRKCMSKDMSLECNSKEAHAYFTHPIYSSMRKRFSQYALSLMLHQMLVSYKMVAHDVDEEEDQGEDDQDAHFGPKPQKFYVLTDKPGEKYNLVWDREHGKITCDCAFFTMNQMICGHAFCLMNALQIKHINYFGYMGEQWSDDINPEDPSTRDLMAKLKQQKKLITFIDKVAEKNRQRRAKHKGGFVPMKKRKINVDFYPSSGSDFENDKNGLDGEGDRFQEADKNAKTLEQLKGASKGLNNMGTKISGDGKRSVEMFELMLPRGTSLKAFSRQEEDRRKVVAKMKKQGLDFDDPLNLNNRNLPNEPLKMPRIENLNMSSDSEDEKDGNISDEVLKEFKLMTEKDQQLARARVENAELEKKLKVEEREEKARRRKKELKRKKKMKKEAKRRKYGSSDSDSDKEKVQPSEVKKSGAMTERKTRKQLEAEERERKNAQLPSQNSSGEDTKAKEGVTSKTEKKFLEDNEAIDFN